MVLRRAPTPAPAMNTIFVGRQPIYGRDLDVHAYELLFRGADLDPSRDGEGDRATSRVILNAVHDIGLDRVVGERQAFLNVTRSFLVGDHPLPVPPERVVLEVLEDVAVDDAVLAGVERLRAQGFRIALDDFEYRDDLRPLLERADLVKLDVLGLEPAEIARRVEQVRPFRVELLAEKIEDCETYELCRALGFQYFQGYFLARPGNVEGRALSPAHLQLLRLLAELQQPDFDFERAQELVCLDLGLSYRLLRHMNSALYGMPRRIESVREALVYLGVDNVRNLTALLLLASGSEKPIDLLAIAVQRAKTCELLARCSGAAAPEVHFTAGLFSMLEAVLEVPMEQALGPLPLAADLREALLEGTGPVGAVLTAALALEGGDPAAAAALGLGGGGIESCVVDALEWVREVEFELREAARD